MAEASTSQNLEHEIDEPIKTCDTKETSDSFETKKTNEQIDFSQPGPSNQGNLNSASNEEATASKADESCETEESEEDESQPGPSPKTNEGATQGFTYTIYENDDISHFDELPTKEDIYMRKAREQQWRARSSFKLLQIDERFKIFEGVTRAVDLLARPGIWTQVLSRRLYMGEAVYINDKRCLFYNELALHQRLERQEKPVYNINENVVIVAVDACGIPPYPGVVQIDGELAQYSTSEHILQQLEGNKADLVVSSRLFDPTEFLGLDVNFQANHIANLLFTTCNILREGGTLVLTAFKESHNELLKEQLLCLFKEVDFFRPKVSKRSDTEHFAICRGFAIPEGFHPKLMGPFLNFFHKDFSCLTGINRILIPFLVCGDVSAYPLSFEDQKMYTQKFTVPFSMQEPSSPRRRFVSDDLGHYLEKMDAAIKSIGLERDPDVAEMQTIKKKYSEAGSSRQESSPSTSTVEKEEEVVFDNGPLYDLIQRTTKIKEYVPKDDKVVVECGAKFSGKGKKKHKPGDSNTKADCPEQWRFKKNSTCTCDDSP